MLLGVVLSAAHRSSTAAEGRIDFATQIAPIFEQHCSDCHGSDDPESGLQLITRETTLAGGNSGPAIVPGHSDASLLIELVAGRHEDDTVMPPEGARLSAQQIALLRNWIDRGALWPDGLTLESAKSTRDHSHREATHGADHWAYLPIRDPTPPEVKQTGWIRSPLDRFVLRRLETDSIAPSPEAGRETLLRRVTFDLIGLPPTPAEIRIFLADPNPGAYERVVGRLLASPHYGEHWARPWLDLCHFAESDGYLTDQVRPVAWRYRDWLIDALNRDLPFDQFTIEQLAGDLLPNATIDQRIATGFLRQTLSNREGGADLEEYRVEQVIDRTALFGTAWLGLTVGCARCHDHKYDALTQKEFYQLYAFFDSADEINIDAPLPGQWEPYQAQLAEYQRQRSEKIKPVREQLETLQKRWEAKLLDATQHPGADHVWDRQWELLGLIWGGGLGEGQLEGTQIVKLPWERRTTLQQDRLLDYFLASDEIIDPAQFAELKLAELKKQLIELKKELPPIGRAPTLQATQIPRETHLLIRGSFRNLGILVQPGTPKVLPPIAETITQGRPPDRLALARWLTSDQQPLTARVAVNRAWQTFFGQGLVSTSADFGKLGQPPTHPELLDWLANQFRQHGWSRKRLHRLIVTSATYRQSSHARSDIDNPNNRRLARQASLRLSAEQLRDATLTASGLLTHTLGGPSVFPPQPESVVAEGFDVQWQVSTGPDRYRRGLYTFTRRQTPFAQNVTFDGADPSQICARRQRSNTPLQALTLLNDPTFFEAARALAARLLLTQTKLDGQPDFNARLEELTLCCLGRSPTPWERKRLADYWRQQLELMQENAAAMKELAPVPTVAGIPAAEGAAWSCLCSVVLNLHEFITRE